MINRKPITFLAVGQIGAIVYAVLTAGVTFKICKTMWGEKIISQMHQNAYLMSHFGWILLVIPLAWFFIVTKDGTKEPSSLGRNIGIYVSGAALFLGGLYLVGFFTLAFLYMLGHRGLNPA